MLYNDVYLNAFSYELPEEMITTDTLEEALQPVFRALHFPNGQLEAMTGIQERRWWPKGFKVSDGAISAGRKALAALNVNASEIDVLLYTGVCRDGEEPATACRVAAELGVGPEAILFDVSNACMGALTGILEVANRLALGHARMGMVVCCESSRDLNEDALHRFLKHHDIEFFKWNLAIFTGGSGAAAIILSRDPNLGGGHRLLGGSVRNDSSRNQLCTWEFNRVKQTFFEQSFLTDSVGVLNHGVALGIKTWHNFLKVMNWTQDDVDKIISHQVGIMHRKTFLNALNIPDHKDYMTYPKLGNIASVSLPLTAAMAHENGFLKKGDRVAMLGFGSGLNCMMLGIDW